MTARVYVPTTLADLATYNATGVVPATADRVVAEDDGEEAEYAALLGAADASAALLDGPGRRVVLVAEAVEADGALPMGLVVAVHVDVFENADPDDDLCWFATQEIPQVLADYS